MAVARVNVVGSTFDREHPLTIYPLMTVRELLFVGSSGDVEYPSVITSSGASVKN